MGFPDNLTEEREANLFALYLLMPESMFAHDIDGIDWMRDEEVRKIAQKYRVPIAAVVLRAVMLADDTGRSFP